MKWTERLLCIWVLVRVEEVGAFSNLSNLVLGGICIGAFSGVLFFIVPGIELRAFKI
jgi:hypothetical protein